MRLTLYAILLTTIQSLAVSTYAQKTRLSLEMSNSSVKEILTEIENMTEFYFLYNSRMVDVERKTDVNFENQNIEKVLTDLFAGTNVNYTIVDRQIVLSRFADSGQALQDALQSGVTGKVTDTKGQTLPGVSVVIKGTSIGTVTDMDGNFRLSNVPNDATLQFSFVGMRLQEITVAGQTVIDVVMEEESIGLEEVVAIGYGIQKRANVTGAVSSVNTEELIANRPITNAFSGLQGVVPGLQITTNSGRPGATGLGINIRGTTSINGGSPLILLDNVPVSTEDVNPQDVENITVLKDASASSIYGARAAFGVILITTKKQVKTIQFVLIIVLQ